MAITATLDATFTGVNISSAASVYSYAAPTGGAWRFQVALSNAAGNGDYVVYAKVQYAGAGSAYIALPKTTATAASGETVLLFPTITLDLEATDVIAFWVDGLAGDTSVNGIVKGWRSEQSVWDEIITNATHNIAQSTGKRLRQVAEDIIIGGTAAAATVNTITLDGDASSSDGMYDPSMISIVGGTGAGQTRMIYQYTGSTKIAVVDRDWKVTPSTDSEYIIMGHPGREHVNEGLLRAATATTAQLNTLASSVDDAYNHQSIFIRSGTGADQVRHIQDYNGTTKTVTVENWDTTPDTTSGYVMLPYLFSEEEIWNYTGGRTLTQSAASVTSAVSGSTITITRGDTLSATITGLASNTGYVSIDFTVKDEHSDADTAAIIKIRKNASGSGDGLLYLNGASGTANLGSITVNSATSITIALAASATDDLEPAEGLLYDVQLYTASAVTTLTAGYCTVSADVTRSVV